MAHVARSRSKRRTHALMKAACARVDGSRLAASTNWFTKVCIGYMAWLAGNASAKPIHNKSSTAAGGARCTKAFWTANVQPHCRNTANNKACAAGRMAGDTTANACTWLRPCRTWRKALAQACNCCHKGGDKPAPASCAGVCVTTGWPPEIETTWPAMPQGIEQSLGCTL